MTREHNHYFKKCPYDEVDVYRILELFGVTDNAIGHAVKKLLVAGGRGGGKDIRKDIKEAIDTLVRWQEMRSEDVAKGVAAWPESMPTAPVDRAQVVSHNIPGSNFATNDQFHRLHAALFPGMQTHASSQYALMETAISRVKDYPDAEDLVTLMSLVQPAIAPSQTIIAKDIVRAVVKAFNIGIFKKV